MTSLLLLAAAFDVVALVDHYDFARYFDIETRKGVLQTLDHVVNTHPTDVWWRDKGGGRARYPSKVEAWPLQEYPFDRHIVPNEIDYGHLRLDRPETDSLSAVLSACQRKGIRFGIHTTFEECHESIPSASCWTMDHPQYWTRMKGRRPWGGSTSLAFPEVATHRLAMLDERLAFRPEAVFLDLHRNGTYHVPPVAREYVKPVVEKWILRHGCEPPADYFDPRWTALVSEHMMDYLRRYGEKCHAAGARFVLGFQMLDTSTVDGGLWRRFAIDWPELASEGVVDGIVVLAVKYDKNDIWGSLDRVYREVMARRGKADVYFNLAVYDWQSDLGFKGIAKHAKISDVESARRLLALARDVGARGVVLECVDFNKYSPEVCAEILKSWRTTARP